MIWNTSSTRIRTFYTMSDLPRIKMYFILVSIFISLPLVLLCTQKRKVRVIYNEETGEVEICHPSESGGQTKKAGTNGRSNKSRHTSKKNTSKNSKKAQNKESNDKFRKLKMEKDEDNSEPLENAKDISDSPTNTKPRNMSKSPSKSTNAKKRNKPAKSENSSEKRKRKGSTPQSNQRKPKIETKQKPIVPELNQNSVKGGDINKIYAQLANDPMVKNVLEQSSEMSDISVLRKFPEKQQPIIDAKGNKKVGSPPPRPGNYQR